MPDQYEFQQERQNVIVFSNIEEEKMIAINLGLWNHLRESINRTQDSPDFLLSAKNVLFGISGGLAPALFGIDPQINPILFSLCLVGLIGGVLVGGILWIVHRQLLERQRDDMEEIIELMDTIHSTSEEPG